MDSSKGGQVSKEITTAKALELLGCSYKTLYRKIVDKTIKAEKRGRDYFFNEDDILALLPVIKKKQLTHAPTAADKKLKKQKEAEAIAKKLEEKIQEAKNKDTPELLDESGKQHLSDLKAQMEELGIYKKVDDPLLFSAALAFQTSLKYEVLAASLDYTSFTLKNGEKEHHYADVAKKHFDRYMSICERLGLTPTARQKIKANNEDGKDEMESLIA